MSPELFRSMGFRVVASYAGLFVASLLALGATVFLIVHAGLSSQLDHRLETEIAVLRQEYRLEGYAGVLEEVGERGRLTGQLHSGLEGPGGRPLGGNLPLSGAPEGWSEAVIHDRAGRRENVRVLVETLGPGYRLLVADDLARLHDVDDAILQAFGWMLLAGLVMGAGGGWLLSRGVARRIDAISSTAEAIIDGDLKRRMPVGASGDELDRLAGTLNRMLERISTLMDSLRQVSSDVAHDLRTPLTRLRQRLEGALAQDETATAEARHENIQRAIDAADGLLETFAALLRIAQIEGGARRAGFRRIDLAETVRTVVDAFAPSAEDAGQRISRVEGEPVVIDGDPELLVQAVANLVENALRHAGPAARVQVGVARLHDEAVLSVADDGPGVPEAQRDRVADRFHRLDQSRSTPGSGLGLSLVAAVASLHDGRLSFADAAPGLIATLHLPLTPRARPAGM